MICYFSGTGNSLYAARRIAEEGEPLLSIAKEMDCTQPPYRVDLRSGERLGLVFPVYAWAPPRLVLDFLRRLEPACKPDYVFCVCTCGKEGGHTARIVERALAKRGAALDSAFSVAMPNNYIFGIELDSAEVSAGILHHADIKLEQIRDALRVRGRGVFDTLPGSLPGLKSALINPLFNRFAMGTGKFAATDSCTGCGLCEKVCPVHSITVRDKPAWRKSCTRCMACINSCPVEAIQYGKSTVGKGRYLHPLLRGKVQVENPQIFTAVGKDSH